MDKLRPTTTRDETWWQGTSRDTKADEIAPLVSEFMKAQK
jgi:hypothetical protein